MMRISELKNEPVHILGAFHYTVYKINYYKKYRIVSVNKHWRIVSHTPSYFSHDIILLQYSCMTKQKLNIRLPDTFCIAS